MSLDEIFRDEPMVSHSEAIAEVNKHNVPVSQFLMEMGHLDEYNGREVLEWLGY